MPSVDKDTSTKDTYKESAEKNPLQSRNIFPDVWGSPDKAPTQAPYLYPSFSKFLFPVDVWYRLIVSVDRMDQHNIDIEDK